MAFLVAFLTLILVLDCIVLVFLVLLQLPKKDAGAGLAFGGAATDALFGAGSGNVLTKITKYAAAIFFITAIILAFTQARRSGSDFERRLQQPGRPAAGALPAPGAAVTPTNASAVPAAEGTDVPVPLTPAPAATSAPAVPTAK
ncbi:MAG TPA: preprotein translocase subunit SecG [Clostridia bacterium]|nr:preprotein translocase subunit SecG [Clostridia bacterium]